MDAQEFRSLQEAYMEVVTNEGWKPLPTEKMKKKQERYKNKSTSPYESGISPSSQADKRISARNKAKKIGDVLSKPSTTRNPKKLRKQSAIGDFLPGGRVHSKNVKEVKEDIYDIILSHLLDEGYAETPEAAEAIMVNMSEEWREDILNKEYFYEELTGLRARRAMEKIKSLGKKKSTSSKRDALFKLIGSKEGTGISSTGNPEGTKTPTKRGGSGKSRMSKVQGSGTFEMDRGDGNRASRRAGTYRKSMYEN